MILPIALAPLAAKTKADAVVVFADGTFRSVALDGNNMVREAQKQAVQFNALVGASAPAAAERGSDPAVKLRKLRELRDAGLLTQGEYEAKRAEGHQFDLAFREHLPGRLVPLFVPKAERHVHSLHRYRVYQLTTLHRTLPASVKDWMGCRSVGHSTLSRSGQLGPGLPDANYRPPARPAGIVLYRASGMRQYQLHDRTHRCFRRI